MGLYMHYDENEDGTMTMTADFGDGEMVAVLPYGLMALIGKTVDEVNDINALIRIGEDAVVVPQDTERLD